MGTGSIPQKSGRFLRGRRRAVSVWIGVLCGLPACGGEEPREGAVEPYEEAVFVPALPTATAAQVQAIAQAIALPPAEVLAAIGARSGLGGERWKALLASAEVDREHPYTSKEDRDASGRHRLAWRVRGRPSDAAERAALDDLRAAVELEVWSLALETLSAFDPTLELRASALEGPRGAALPRRIGERAALALERLTSRGLPCDRWERVRTWCAARG